MAHEFHLAWWPHPSNFATFTHGCSAASQFSWSLSLEMFHSISSIVRSSRYFNLCSLDHMIVAASHLLPHHTLPSSWLPCEVWVEASMVPRLPHLFMSASHGQYQGLLSVRAEVRLPDHNCTNFFMTVQLSSVKEIWGLLFLSQTSCNGRRIMGHPTVVAHTFNHSNKEEEVGRFLCVWGQIGKQKLISGQLGLLHRDTLSQTPIPPKKKHMLQWQKNPMVRFTHRFQQTLCCYKQISDKRSLRKETFLF